MLISGKRSDLITFPGGGRAAQKARSLHSNYTADMRLCSHVGRWDLIWMLTRPKSVEKHRFRRPMAIVLLQRSLLCQCRVLVFFIYLRLYVPPVLRAATICRKTGARKGWVAEEPKKRASIRAASPLLELMVNCKFITNIVGNNDGHYV